MEQLNFRFFVAKVKQQNLRTFFGEKIYLLLHYMATTVADTVSNNDILSQSWPK